MMPDPRRTWLLLACLAEAWMLSLLAQQYLDVVHKLFVALTGNM